MHDVLPEDSYRWQAFEQVVRDLMDAYGYREIRMPAVESTDLFCRSIGEVTDIVSEAASESFGQEIQSGELIGNWRVVREIDRGGHCAAGEIRINYLRNRVAEKARG